jgi:hypothetical protein
LFPGWRTVSLLTPIHREYLAVESAAPALPQEFTLITVPTAEAALRGDVRYAGLLARMGKRAYLLPPGEVGPMPYPWLFLEDIACWTYTFSDLTGVRDTNTGGNTLAYRWDHVLFGHQRSAVRPPVGPRPECQPFLSQRTLGPRQIIVDPDDDPPFLFYASNAVPIQFHELDSQQRLQ